MEYPKAGKYSTRVSDLYYLNDAETYLLVKLELVKPDRISFLAGQFISIAVSENGERRSYSIASTPDMNHAVELLAEIIPGGKGSEYLKKLKPGDTVEILGPLGRFVVDDEIVQQTKGDKKLLFVATGSGIAPIGTMINDLLINRKATNPIRLTWGMRNEQQLFWFDNFQRLAEEYPNFVYDPVLSKPSDNWTLCMGHVQDCVKRDFVSENMALWETYVCGNPEMVESNRKLFEQIGLPVLQFHQEKFG